METYQLVHPEHLNHYGHLFGGNLLKWVDEQAWIAASIDYPNILFVTVGMDKVEFKKGVQVGTVLRFDIQRTRVGQTSVTYRVDVYNGADIIFSTHVTFVHVDEHGHKKQLPEI